jgi:hypothetical protein
MKKQIEFDFAKWGQDGISVEWYGQKVLSMHINPTSSAYYYGMVNGTTCFNTTQSNLTMFEEVNPREFWVNVYNNGNGYCYNSQSIAKQALADNGQTIKVREVLS